MSAHHPGTWAAHSSDKVDLTDAPWALTTHLLAINNQQMRRATRHPFLERAAKGALPKHMVAQWLSNDRQYIEGYISVTKHTLNLVRSTPDSTIDPDIQRRLITWLETAIKNGERERDLFNEVAEIYKIDVYPAPLQDNVKSEGLRRYEALFNSVMSQQPNSFIPWLEGAVLLWATEKIYYEAWSWARRQDTKGSPRSYDTDMDGGAMRREFIPNWANRVFLMFVEQLERIINEGVSIAVNRDAQRWIEVKSRADPIWRALLDAEEAFWPNVNGNEGSLIEPGVQRREDGKMDGTTLRSTGDNEILNDQQGVRASDMPAMRSNEQMVK